MLRRSRRQLLTALLGLAAIACGIVCNEVAYTFFFTKAVWSSTATKIGIWLADAALVAAGMGLVWWSRVKWAVDAATLIVTTVVLVAVIEGVCGTIRTVSSPADEKTGSFLNSGHQPDAHLGDKAWPDTRKSHVHRVGGATVFDVDYTFDAFGRRVTTQSDVDARREFLAFFGCSFTFGEGVEDDETMPSRTAALAPSVHVYNYGFSGYGPHQMLAQLQGDTMRAEIAEPSGIGVYTFIDHHVRRVSGTSDGLWGYLWDGPFFTVGPDGRLTTPGGFRWSRTPLTFLNYVVSRSQTAALFHRSFPPPSDAQTDLAVRVIEEARNTFVAKFDSDRFYVLIYPGVRSGPVLIPRLQRAGLKVLDYARLFDGRAVQASIPNDGHPTPEAHRLVARKLVDDLGIAAASPEAE